MAVIKGCNFFKAKKHTFQGGHLFIFNQHHYISIKTPGQVMVSFGKIKVLNKLHFDKFVVKI